MSTATPGRSGVDEPRFRDALRSLPGRVWIVSLGILVNRVGNFLPVFIVLYLIGRGYSAGAAGLVLGVSGLGNVLGNTVGGYLADKIGRRWTIVVSAVPTAGLTAIVPSLGSFPIIVTVVGLIGVTSQIYRPAAAAVLLDSVTTNQQRLAAFAVFRFALNIGAALGGVIGGVLASTSYVGLFLGNAAACLLFGVVVAVLLRDAPQPRSDQHDADTQADRAVGYRQALADRTLVRFLLMTLVGEFVYIQCTVGLPLHVSDVGLSARDFGLLIGLNGLVVLVLELPTTGAVSRYRPEYVLAVGNLLIGAGLALTGLMNGMVLLSATVLIWTLGEMMSSSVAMAYLGSLTPPRMAGRYQGLYGAAYTVGTGAGPLIGGAMYAIGPWALWTLVAAAGLLAAQLCLPRRRATSTVNEPAS
ncbi:putative MFS family arabinose efflux permease [Kribbella orskensis]|uniref:MFS family arabinose efflux permease n=1 Tax=Kribbella orskensis TaxID=2512216 RepID=A0ABY2B777_9ACTN|nr:MULTISPECIES: MFS transporter [Kribbella]TCN29988.1 putative MFS family arabinose efflux permease [Kribbella sp. VKM Ac-2500]TCO10100.1 putative MFS family arabinose efflux permease [Kribbella orskensis]